MAIEIFRAYINSGLPIQDGDHKFSIIASETDVAYAAPHEVIDSYGLTQERIDMAKDLYTASNVEMPTTPTDWAILASTNMSQISVIPFDVSEPYETIEQAVIDETSDAQDALEIRDENQSVEPITAAADACPPATQDISINLANREKAIKDAAYGPLNPAEPNEEFWQEKSTRWSITPDEAKKSRCGNCVMFITTTKMKDCIAQGIEQGGSSEDNAWDAVDAAELGYCEAFDFKCAASRTCNAWVAGGPIDDSKAKE